MEELIFSSSRNVEAAIMRMKAAGIIFSTYKMLYYELIEAVESRHPTIPQKALGPFPDDLPESALA